MLLKSALPLTHMKGPLTPSPIPACYLISHVFVMFSSSHTLHAPATPPQLTDSTLAQPSDSAATKLLIAWLIIYNPASTHSPFRIKLFLSFWPNFPGLFPVSSCPGVLEERRSPWWSCLLVFRCPGVWMSLRL